MTLGLVADSLGHVVDSLGHHVRGLDDPGERNVRKYREK